MARLVKPVIIVLVYCLVTFGFLEIGLRIWFGVDPLKLVNFRTEHKIEDQFKGLVRYDPDLGWTMSPNTIVGDLGTVNHGIRRNSATQTSAEPGGWLVSGSSFTAGSGADDANTWPALLEGRENIAVHNAAVGGFALDQVVLRAESLLDIMKPDVLFVDLMQTTISWTGYSVLTRPKPYFVVKDGELQRPVPAVPLLEKEPAELSLVWHYAAYSYLIDRVMAAIDAQTWYARTGESVVNAPGDPVEVSCALLDRIAAKTAERGIRLVIVSIPTGQEIAISKEPASVVAQVEQCAMRSGLQIVPIRQRMHEDIESGIVKPEDIYLLSDGLPIGHMTIPGNEYVARIVHETLKLPFDPAALSVAGATGDDGQAVSEQGDSGNLLESSEKLTAYFTPTKSGVLTRENRNTDEIGLFRLQGLAAEPQNKPTIVSRTVAVDAGSYVLSMEIKPQTARRFTIQLSSGDHGSVTSGYDFRRNVPYVIPSHIALGRDWKATLEELEDGWFRISLRLTLPETEFQILPGLGNENGALSVSAGEASVLVRRMQFERGKVASEYKPTRGPKAPELVGNGENLLPDTETLAASLSQSRIIAFSPEKFLFVFGTETFRFEPIGDDTEHYVRFQQSVTAGESYVFSFDVKRDAANPLRVQMFDGGQNGGYADFEFSTETVQTSTIGDAVEVLAAMTPATSDGWQTLRVSIPVGDSDLFLTLQTLHPILGAKFDPSGKAHILRNVRLEKRISATE